MAPFSWARWLRSLVQSRGRTYRKSNPRKSRRLHLEGLEDRTLLSVLPAAVVSNPANVAAGGFSPSLAQDPVNALKLVEVHITNSTNPTTGAITYQLAGDFSTNGGQTWTAAFATANLGDPNTSPGPNPPTGLPGVPFVQATNATVAMD